jgi:tetratricopeptide (TPR) repeat protein
LRIDGEVEYAVPPLARADAVALFCERSGLSPTADIEELCVRLDELPLAVELAAARTTAMSPPMILERLARRLDLLKGGRDSDPRQQTLRATIEWSYDLLSADERDLFVRLSVFAGGWTLDAAEIVAGADIDTLQSLVEKSLVRFLNDRYQMLATIREFAAELALAGDPALAQRHAEYFRDMVLHIDGQLRGANEDELMDLLEADHNNVRAALAWAAENDPRSMVRTATAMARYWWMRGTSTEARRWFELAVDISDGAEPSLIAMAKAELAYCACMASDWPTVRANGWEALAAARELGMHELALRAIPPLIDLLSFDKDWENADRLTEEGIEHARASGDLFRQAAAVYNYGESLRLRGDLPAARAKMEEALRLSEESGSQEGIASSRIGIGSVMRAQGDLDGALKILRQALAGLLEIGFRERVVWGLLEFAGIFLDQRQLDLAARLLGAADALSEGVPWNEQTDPIQNELLKELGADELGRLRAEGSKLSAAQAAELCGVQLVGSPA